MGSSNQGGNAGAPDARQTAFDILMRVQEGSHTLDHWLEQHSSRMDRLTRPDRALASALVFGVLRWQGRLDWIIGRLADRRAGIDPSVRTILRLALCQIFFMERIPASAAVNTAVNLTRKIGRTWATGFVNGLLRRALSSTGGMAWPDPVADPVGHLASVHSFPEWIIQRWMARWDFETTEQLCRAINTIPKITLRTNTLKTTREALIRSAAGDDCELGITSFSPEGVQSLSSRMPPTRLGRFDDGWFQVQDEAAQLISHLAAPRPGQTVWDACAGLGTKTAHLAQLMGNQGSILASDSRQEKLQRLSAEMQRLGVTIVQTQSLDLIRSKNHGRLADFDCILVDAPCSGAGVMQRNPDTKWRLKPDDFKRNHLRQLTLLERAAPHLKPGGRLVYSVCSFEPEENSTVIEAFLQKHAEFVIERPELKTAPSARGLITGEGFLSTLPHRHGMDGFFASSLRKRS